MNSRNRFPKPPITPRGDAEIDLGEPKAAPQVIAGSMPRTLDPPHPATMVIEPAASAPSGKPPREAVEAIKAWFPTIARKMHSGHAEKVQEALRILQGYV